MILKQGDDISFVVHTSIISLYSGHNKLCNSCILIANFDYHKTM